MIPMNPETYFPLLLDLFLKSVAMLSLAAVAGLAARRVSAANRHLVWHAAMLALLLLPATKLADPHWSWALKPAPTAATADQPPIVFHSELTDLPDASATIEASKNTPSSWSAVTWPSSAVTLWLAGALAILAWRATVGWRVRRLVRRSAVARDARVLAMADDLGAEAEVRVSEHSRVPLAFGVRRPLVLLPVQALGWSDARLRAALLHELGHLRRGDCLARLMADAVCALYWMNPLVWMAARAMRMAQEQACDDIVLRAGGDATDYASQLVDVVRSLGADRLSTRHALAMAQPSTLETRVRSIVDGTRDRRPLSRRVAAGGIVAVLALLAVCAAAQLSAVEKSGLLPEKNPATAPADAQAPQVQIEAKFIQITEEAEGLRAMSWLPKGAAADKARGGVLGLLSGPEAQAALVGIAATKGVDVLSTPRVVMRSKQQAVIEIVREFRYPSDWEKDGKPGAWKPITFEIKNVGTTLTVTPSLNADGSIDLDLQPQVVEFEGFTDLDSDGKGVPVEKVQEGHRAQPIFSTRKLDAKISLQPDHTAILQLSPSHDDRASQRLLVLVTPKIVKGLVAGLPAPPAGEGKMEITPKSAAPPAR